MLLGPLLESKLPRDVLLQWGRKKKEPTEQFDVDLLLAFAKDELETRERLLAQTGFHSGSRESSTSERRPSRRSACVALVLM
jgi:hypothetical protein